MKAQSALHTKMLEAYKLVVARIFDILTLKPPFSTKSKHISKEIK